MILIGMFDSPFVRRVAVSLHHFNMPFEHRNWSVGKDFERIREFNPLGRVPTLVLDGGESLIESAAILDYLDDCVGADRALLPRSGAQRREALRLMATATGAAEKGVLQIYESAFRPPEKRHAPWLDRCRTQVHAALELLEQSAGDRQHAKPGAWLIGEQLTQADVTAACVFKFLCDAPMGETQAQRYPALAAHAARAELLPEFLAVRPPAFAAPVAEAGAR